MLQPTCPPLRATGRIDQVSCPLCGQQYGAALPDNLSPLHQLTCANCEGNLVLITAAPEEPSLTAHQHAPKPATALLQTKRLWNPDLPSDVLSSVGLYLSNALLGLLLCASFVQTLGPLYDPDDLSEHPYAPIILRLTGWTSLHLAAARGDVESVTTLLDGGASVSSQTNLHESPLHVASKRGHAEVVAVLLRHGSPTDTRGTSDFTPLHDAAWHGHTAVVQELITHRAALDSPATDENLTPLHMAALRGNAALTSLLLNAGASPSRPNKDQETSLHIVAGTESEKGAKIARLLIQHGADLDARDNRGFAPLNLAARQGTIAMAEVLVAHGAHIESRTLKDSTPLHQAAWSGNVAIVRYLLDHGADPNVRNLERMTPMLLAVTRNHTEVVQVLLDRGARPNARIVGKTALDYAKECECHAEIHHLLLAHGAQTFPDLLQQAKHGVALYNAQRYREALDAQTHALSLAPQDADMHFNRALTWFALQDPASAIGDLERAMALEPTYLPPYETITNIFSRDRKAAAAIPYWNRLIAHRPDHAKAHYQRGLLLWHLPNKTPTQSTQALLDLRTACQLGNEHGCVQHEMYSKGLTHLNLTTFRRQRS